MICRDRNNIPGSLFHISICAIVNCNTHLASGSAISLSCDNKRNVPAQHPIKRSTTTSSAEQLTFRSKSWQFLSFRSAFGTGALSAGAPHVRFDPTPPNAPDPPDPPAPPPLPAEVLREAPSSERCAIDPDAPPDPPEQLTLGLADRASAPIAVSLARCITPTRSTYCGKGAYWMNVD